MGEIADSLINGDFDFYTGEYIGRGKGVPRTLNKSLDWEKSKRKSEDLSWKKVTGLLNNLGIKRHKHPQVLKAFGCNYSGKSPLRNACFEALKKFKNFKEFAANWKEPFATNLKDPKEKDTVPTDSEGEE